ncbi:yippee-like-like protein [Drosera capensis]
MGRVFVVELEGKSYKCRFCKTHLALAQDLVSRGMHCRREEAYVFKRVVNVFVGPAKDNTNLSRTVTEIFCCCCGQMVGWKFEAAPRKHREGLFLLEWGRIIEFEESVNNHELDAETSLDSLEMREAEDP